MNGTVDSQKTQAAIQGRKVPRNLLGRLCEAEPQGDLASQLDRHGYLLLRQAHDPAEVLAARHEVLTRLAEVDEVEMPANAVAGRQAYAEQPAVATGRSSRLERYPDPGAFWRSVSEGLALRRVINGSRMTSLMSRLFGEAATHFDFAWLRAMTAGRASPLHIDHPYMNRGTDRLVTIWSPLGSVGFDQGPLFVLEGSHRWADLRLRFEGHDVDRDKSKPGFIEEHALDLAASHGSRILTAEFAPGDVLIFGMFLAHASLDNQASGGRIRLSCDTRFQPAGEPMDERFSGPNPSAHGGKGYACLSAAQPMTTPPSAR